MGFILLIFQIVINIIIQDDQFSKVYAICPSELRSKFSHIFLREVNLGEKLYFGGIMICCNFFLTNKELMDRKMKRHKDKHRNNFESCQSQVTWKLEFKCQFPRSCLSIIICTTCNF